MYIFLKGAFKLLNHQLPFSRWSLDHAYKEGMKLLAPYSSESIGITYERISGNHAANVYNRIGGNNALKKRFYLKTDQSQLTAEEKESEHWYLAEKDKRNTSPLAANSMVMNTEYELPLGYILSQGITRYIISYVYRMYIV